MTYADLKDLLKEFTDAELDQTVTIYVRDVDEYYSLVDDYPLVESDESCDVLDPGHKYIVI